MPSDHRQKFADALQTLIDSGDGDWRGFIFPDSLLLADGLSPSAST
jgi:hypothetical protein